MIYVCDIFYVILCVCFFIHVYCVLLFVQSTELDGKLGLKINLLLLYYNVIHSIGAKFIFALEPVTSSPA